MQEMQETWVQSLDQEDPLEKEMTTHSSILAGKVLWTEEVGYSPWGHKETQPKRLSTQCVHTHTHTHIYTHTLILSVCGLHENYMQRKSLDSKMSVS